MDREAICGCLDDVHRGMTLQEAQGRQLVKRYRKRIVESIRRDAPILERRVDLWAVLEECVMVVDILDDAHPLQQAVEEVRVEAAVAMDKLYDAAQHEQDMRDAIESALPPSERDEIGDDSDGESIL